MPNNKKLGTPRPWTMVMVALCMVIAIVLIVFLYCVYTREGELHAALLSFGASAPQPKAIGLDVVATVEGFYARAWTMLMGAGGMAGVILLVIVPLVLQRLQSQSFRDHKEDFRERAADDTKKLLQRTREELRTTMESHTKKLLTTMESDTKKLLERTRGELSTSMESLMLGYALWGQANARGADDQHMRVLDFLKAAQAFKRAKKPGLIARALQWAQICLGRRAVNVAVFAQDANLESQIQSAILGLKLPDNETQGLLRSLNEARERPAPGSEDSRAEQPEGPGPETAE